MGIGGVVVNAEVDRRVKAPGKHLLRGHIHGNDIGGAEVCRGKIRLYIGQELFDDGVVGVEPGGLPLPAQGAAQGGGAAHGVPVRVFVGDKKDIIPLRKEPGTFLKVHCSLPRRV